MKASVICYGRRHHARYANEPAVCSAAPAGWRWRTTRAATERPSLEPALRTNPPLRDRKSLHRTTASSDPSRRSRFPTSPRPRRAGRRRWIASSGPRGRRSRRSRPQRAETTMGWDCWDASRRTQPRGWASALVLLRGERVSTSGSLTKGSVFSSLGTAGC